MTDGRPRVPGCLVSDADFVLWNAPVAFRVEGASRGAEVTFEVTGKTADGTAASTAVIVVGADGTADPARHEAIDGTYTGIDPRGLWWSLEPVTGTQRFATDFVVTATVAGVELGCVTLERSAISPRARYGALPEPNVGYWFEPDGDAAAPPVLVLGGTEGGVQSSTVTAALLAEEGFLTAALAYCGAPGLPETLKDVPLEYFLPGLDWLIGHDRSTGEPVRVVGSSRGGELALLLGPTFPDRVGPIVSISGGGIVWNGYPPADAPGEVIHAWTRDGKPVPCPRVPGDELLDLDLIEVIGGREAIVGAPGFEWFLDNVPDSVGQATIPVERCGGPLLLIAGEADHVFPAVRVAQMTVERARVHNGPTTTLVVEKGAGHYLGPPGDAMPTVLPAPEGPGISLGGTRAANAAAQIDAWERTVEFLKSG